MSTITSELVLTSEFDCFWNLPEEKNVSDYILRRTGDHAKAGRRTCIQNLETGEAINYGEIDPISRKIASKLFKQGLRQGDTVVYSTHDPAKVHVLLVGVWRANGIVRSCYPEERADSLIKQIKESQATFLACDEAYVQECLLAVESITEWKIQLIIFGKPDLIPEGCLSIREFYEDDGSSVPPTSATLNDIALILPTSGTTGDSKGAIYTHKILLENILAHENMPCTDRDEEPSIITSRPTHYVGSIVALSFITRGRLLLMASKVSTEGLLEAVQKYKVRAIGAFPTYITGMVNHPNRSKYDLSSLHYLTVAGQVIVPEAMTVIRKLPNLKTFINLYGMTEAGLLVTSSDWTSMKNGIATDLLCQDYSVGKLAPNTSLKVVDMDTGKNLGPNCKGELCFKTPVATAGYLHRPEEESKTFLEGGWVRTGDVGYYDENGFVFVVDRAKEVFKWHNNHICPSEVENVLLRHSSISQAVVFGVPEKDGQMVPRALVVLKKGENVQESELIRFAENNLPSYKHLKGGLFILPEIPLGKTGKVTRKLLSQLELPPPQNSF